MTTYYSTCGANNLLQDYRKGNFKGTSNDDERDIFENVTFSIVDLVKNVTIRFPMKRNNKKGERRKKTVQPQDIKSREIKYLNMGKCFEIQLDQFNEPLGYIEFYFKKSGYIYVNSEGQFHNRDSFSKVRAWFVLPAQLIHWSLEGGGKGWPLPLDRTHLWGGQPDHRKGKKDKEIWKA